MEIYTKVRQQAWWDNRHFNQKDRWVLGWLNAIKFWYRWRLTCINHGVEDLNWSKLNNGKWEIKRIYKIEITNSIQLSQ